MWRFLLFLFVIFLLVKVFSCSKEGSITFTTPNNGEGFNSTKTIIKGKIEPEEGILDVKASGDSFQTQINIEDGVFEVEVPLPDTSNFFNFELKEDVNSSGRLAQNIAHIRRNPSPEEIVKSLKIEKFEKAKSLAADRAWYKSKAGRIQRKHPDWSREDCRRLAKRNIWIGMDIAMLKYMYGLPNHANPSNYGGTTQWQWCWDDYTPSCYYDRDGDGLIDAYN